MSDAREQTHTPPRPTGHLVPEALRPTDGAAADYTDRRAPEPSHAERARTIVGGGGRATLATIAQDPAGHPFASVANVAVDGDGRPVTFVSTMAEHTRNLLADPRCSVLLAEVPGETGADALALGRVTLLGEMTHLADDTAERADARERFLARNPQAFYVDYGDFLAWRLDVTAIRYVGGFGRMSWVDVEGYSAAAADPLIDVAAGAIAHMNDDHADALLAAAQAFGGAPDATAATISALDRYGFDLVAQTPSGRRALRVGFGSPLHSGDQVRTAMVEVVGLARAALPNGPDGPDGRTRPRGSDPPDG